MPILKSTYLCSDTKLLYVGQFHNFVANEKFVQLVEVISCVPNQVWSVKQVEDLLPTSSKKGSNSYLGVVLYVETSGKGAARDSALGIRILAIVANLVTVSMFLLTPTAVNEYDTSLGGPDHCQTVW